MKGGGKEPYSVPIHSDGGILRIKYLHDLEDSVKARTPLAGEGISIVRTNLGSTIKLSSSVTCQILSFNVCSNGTPSEIAMLCVVTEPNTLYDYEKRISYTPIFTAM